MTHRCPECQSDFVRRIKDDKQEELGGNGYKNMYFHACFDCRCVFTLIETVMRSYEIVKHGDQYEAV